MTTIPLPHIEENRANATATVRLSVRIPTRLYRALIQHLRDFDVAHDPKHEGIIEIVALSEVDSVDEFMDSLQKVRPPFQFIGTRRTDS